MAEPDNGTLHVAAAVVVDEAARILLALRPAHKHQGGLWEFPGGKLEPGEDVQSALRRELHEELGIETVQARPLIRIPYRYPDRRVLLDVWRVERFEGVAHGREGQPIRWVAPQDLADFPMPAANLPIAMAARLPDRYFITPEPGSRPQWPQVLTRLEAALRSGIRLVQWRAKQTGEESAELAQQVIALCHTYGAWILRNSACDGACAELGFDGVHLTSTDLLATGGRPEVSGLVAASCHDEAQLLRAIDVGVDFAVLSPVAPTASHPGATSLGWEGFRRLSEMAPFPVYALGGMTTADLARSWANGGQGIAAIREFWSGGLGVAS